MKTIEIEVLSETSNCPVVQMRGRKFPGVVLQGDSLRILFDLSQQLAELSSRAEVAELSETALSLKNKLAGYVAVYENAVQANGLQLPYPSLR